MKLSEYYLPHVQKSYWERLTDSSVKCVSGSLYCIPQQAFPQTLLPQLLRRSPMTDLRLNPWSPWFVAHCAEWHVPFVTSTMCVSAETTVHCALKSVLDTVMASLEKLSHPSEGLPVALPPEERAHEHLQGLLLPTFFEPEDNVNESTQVYQKEREREHSSWLRRTLSLQGSFR